jgi:hypothetical protein
MGDPVVVVRRVGAKRVTEFALSDWPSCADVRVSSAP